MSRRRKLSRAAANPWGLLAVLAALALMAPRVAGFGDESFPPLSAFLEPPYSEIQAGQAPELDGVPERLPDLAPGEFVVFYLDGEGNSHLATGKVKLWLMSQPGEDLELAATAGEGGLAGADATGSGLRRSSGSSAVNAATGHTTLSEVAGDSDVDTARGAGTMAVASGLSAVHIRRSEAGMYVQQGSGNVMATSASRDLGRAAGRGRSDAPRSRELTLWGVTGQAAARDAVDGYSTPLRQSSRSGFVTRRTGEAETLPPLGGETTVATRAGSHDVQQETAGRTVAGLTREQRMTGAAQRRDMAGASGVENVQQHAVDASAEGMAHQDPAMYRALARVSMREARQRRALGLALGIGRFGGTFENQFIEGLFLHGFLEGLYEGGSLLGENDFDRIQTAEERDVLLGLLDKETVLALLLNSAQTVTGKTAAGPTTWDLRLDLQPEIRWHGHLLALTITVENTKDIPAYGTLICLGVPEHTGFVGFARDPRETKGYTMAHLRDRNMVVWKVNQPLVPGITLHTAALVKADPWIP